MLADINRTSSRTGIIMALRELVNANVRWSRATERHYRLPTDKTLWQRFEREADALIRALPDGATVLDLGGGRRCVYAGSVQPPGRVKLIAVDISAEELALNGDVAETRVADVAAGLPLPDGSVDLILSRALLEHVQGVPAAIRHMARVLKAGGTASSVRPARPARSPRDAVDPWLRGVSRALRPLLPASAGARVPRRRVLRRGVVDHLGAAWLFRGGLPCVPAARGVRVDGASSRAAQARRVYRGPGHPVTARR